MKRSIDKSEKIIRDSLHGYIYLPEKVFDLLIDTPIFQRLRRIEQTSMRSLYPSARHDRFAHSLGTYHLGKNAAEALYGNIKCSKYYFKADAAFWEKQKFVFGIACLLHDCAHAPFSHSLEYLYFYDDGINAFKERFVNYWLEAKQEWEDESNYIEDIEMYFGNKPNAHESASAVVVAEYFGCRIKQLLTLYGFDYSPSDIEFIQRAIMGVKYRLESEPASDVLNDEEYRHKNIKNCLISLLNSKSFDVDKLDYIIRDSQESGVDNISVDIERLIKSLVLVEKHEFSSPTDIDTEFSNSFVFNTIVGNVDYANGINEINIYLDGGAEIEGNFNGTIDFLEGSSYNSYTIVETEESPKQYLGVKKFSGEKRMKAIVNKGIIKGNFVGTISSASGTLDGEMNCHLKGKIAGVVIGHIDGADKGKTTFEIGYRSSAINVIEDIVIARNRLYLWIYAHQKVTYTDYILRLAAIYSYAKRSEKYNSGLPLLEQQCIGNGVLSEAVSLRSLLDKSSLYYLFEDSDIYSEIKKPCNDDLEIRNEYLSRQHKHAIWKSYADFNSRFSNLSNHNKKNLWRVLFNSDLADETPPFSEGDSCSYENSVLNSFDDFADTKFVWIKPAGIKLAELNVNDTYVTMNNSVRRLKDVMVRTKTTEQFADENFFYLYSSKELSSVEKSALIGKVKKFLNDSR